MKYFDINSHIEWLSRDLNEIIEYAHNIVGAGKGGWRGVVDTAADVVGNQHVALEHLCQPSWT